MATQTLLNAATASARSRKVGNFNGSGEVLIALRGTIGSGSATIDISLDGGSNWCPTGAVFSSSDTGAKLVACPSEALLSVNYTAGGGSSWTVEAI